MMKFLSSLSNLTDSDIEGVHVQVSTSYYYRCLCTRVRRRDYDRVFEA